MKTIIAGGRDYIFTREDIDKLHQLRKKLPITEVVGGGANGADLCGKTFAKVNHIPYKEFKARWGCYGKSAGPIRNKQMAEYADALIAFPGGRGTEDMIRQAKEKGLKIINPHSNELPL